MHLSITAMTAVRLVRGRVLLFALLAAGTMAPVFAQRHPESAGALPYYNDDPGITKDPPWTQRPPFLRGPQDRYDRGLGRTFLNSDNGQSYTNFADEKYILYFRQTVPWAAPSGRPIESRNVGWDRVGNYMGPNYRRVFSLEESRSGTDQSGYSYIDHKALSFNIGHYTYHDLHWTATVGNGVSASSVRTILTPLTLTSSLQNVLRMDINYRGQDQATLFYTRGGEQGAALLFSGWAKGGGDDTFDNSPVLNFGGHWQHALGDYASFGGTLVNQIMASPASARSSFTRGDLPGDMLGPRVIRVFVADDSPDETQANALVYGMDMIVEGERGGQSIRLTSIDGDPDYDPSLEAGPPTGGNRIAGGGLQAIGHEVVIYAFEMPSDVTVRSARFVADVAGDYRIGVRQTHGVFSVTRQGQASLTEAEWPASFSNTEASVRRPHKWYVGDTEEPYYTVARSSGRSSSGDNRRQVSFDYGIPTGQNLASVNWNAELVGLDISGEVAHNMQNFMFPIGSSEGARSDRRAWAWWLKGVKDLVGDLAVGAEVYRMDPDYAGGYDSYRGGMAFHLDSQASPGAKLRSETQEFPLHEDNDDHDRFPDDHTSDSAVAQPRPLYPGYPNAQVYPGLDDNVDNIPDVDRNENFIVDWEEAFLTYDAEPPEFVYGVDFNNNGVPDFRENDDKPDYPYPRDQKGQHFFLRFNGLGPLGEFITAGRYDNRQIVGGGRAEAVYLRYEYNVAKQGVGQLRMNFDTKKVKDDIADHTYVYTVPPDDIEFINWINKTDGPPEEEGFRRPATPDPLQMRDSWVNTAFLTSKYQGFRDLQLENSALWYRNSQSDVDLVDGSGLLQEEDVHSRFAVVNKIARTWVRGALSITPKFKHRMIYAKMKSEDEPRVSYNDFIPIVMGQYNLTPKTNILAGVQGLPLIPFHHWDRVNKDISATQTDYMVMVRITADYFGIRDNSFYMGYQRTRKDFTRAGRPDFKQGILFVELISPF
jgi:hypothetical protein